MAKVTFKWDDPFLLNDQLSDEERMVRDSARKYCQDKLMPRILEANRHETFDRSIFYEMGQMGFLGPTLPEKYGCPELNSVCYGLITREVERVLWLDRTESRQRPGQHGKPRQEGGWRLDSARQQDVDHQLASGGYLCGLGKGFWRPQ